MPSRVMRDKVGYVSLFTREWIEICAWQCLCVWRCSSPSLRGSGLKCPRPGTYSERVRSPSLRGSGLKSFLLRCPASGTTSPSLRGSGLKSAVFTTQSTMRIVSLFTREWIEIEQLLRLLGRRSSLPLYEGVD